jgi:APA family basic amino acid/polyamine antiporter
VEKENKQLIQGIGSFTAFALVFGSMIGSGVFKKAAPMSFLLGDGYWVLACWVLAGLITLMGALTNAEVAGIIAEPGGQYVYFKRMYGRFFAFFYGWSSFAVIQSATAASVAYIFGESLAAFLPPWPIPNTWEQWTFLGLTPLENLQVKALTVGLLFLLATVNHFGVKYGGRLSGFMASLVVVCIYLVTILSFGWSDGQWSHIEAVGVAHPPEHSLLGTGMFGLFFAGLMQAFWAYEGWNTIGFLGGEVRNPYKTIPRALILGTVFVMLVYVLANAAYLYVLPAAELALIPEGKIAAVEVVRTFLGTGGALAISALILLSTFNSTNTTILGAPRIYFAMAGDGLFFKSVGKVHAQYKTPSRALFLQVAWSSLLVFSGSFDALTDMLVFAAFIFYGAGALGVFVLRKRMPDTPRPFKVPWYPILPGFFVLFCIFLVGISILQDPMNALAGLGLMATGIPFWFYWNKAS